MSENQKFEERLLNSYRDALFKFKTENKGRESPWGDLSQILLEAIGKNHELEKLKIELQQEKAKNLKITTSFEEQLQLKDAQVADLHTILRSNHSYQENLELKDTISELETDLKWYKENCELQQETAENLEITASFENQIRLEDAHINDLLNILQSNHSYQENLELKDKISELEIDLEWYKEKDEYRNIEGAIEKLKVEGPEEKSDEIDKEESDMSWTSWEDEDKSSSFSDMDDIKGYGIFD
ncbi:unnamed protein product [Caenorhabditis nigoni]